MGNNIQEVSDALLCSNCGACKAVCPKDAISFAITPLGRMAATVDRNCVNCGICTKVCPSLDKQNLHLTFTDRFVGNIRNVYIGKSTDDVIFKNSQSGGACTAIVTYLFDIGAIDCAVLCRMEYGNPPSVKPVVVADKNQLADCQKSCYTPVDLLSALRETGDKKSVAVVGLPCHIQGVEALLKCSKKFGNIRYKIGLVCDRTLCGGIQKVMLSYVRPEKSVKIVWRNKRPLCGNGNYVYKNAPVTIINTDGKESTVPNLYRFAQKEYFTSPRCRVCYDKLNTFSDIVLGDPWGMSGIDWENGESVIITRSITGEMLLNEMSEANYISLNPANVDELLKGQHIDARRIQVSRYSKALKVLPMKMDSYLYEQGNGLSINDVKEEENEIFDFMRRDSLSEDEIICECKKNIKKYITRQKLNKLFIVRILRKIKRLFVL